MDSNDLALLEKLGVEGVLAEMAKGEGRLGRPGSEVREEINHWLAAKMLARQEASSAANLSIARNAERWAMWATIIAVIAIAVGIKDQIISLFIS
ncbi:MAG: hypothetical protein IPM27_00565 [Nitrosomonadales bacterium]|nr:hypothetical protein [Nitrosomonadales bacterium]